MTRKHLDDHLNRFPGTSHSRNTDPDRRGPEHSPPHTATSSSRRVSSSATAHHEDSNTHGVSMGTPSDSVASEGMPHEALPHDGDCVVGVHHSDGVMIVEQHLPANHEATSDTHPYPHLSILISGEVVVHKTVPLDDPAFPLKTKEVSQHLIAPAIIEIEAQTPHHIYALTPTIWLCVHSTVGEVDPSIEQWMDDHANHNEQGPDTNYKPNKPHAEDSTRTHAADALAMAATAFTNQWPPDRARQGPSVKPATPVFPRHASQPEKPEDPGALPYAGHDDPPLGGKPDHKRKQ